MHIVVVSNSLFMAMNRQQTTSAAWCAPCWLGCQARPEARAASWSCRACYSHVCNLVPSLHLHPPAHHLVSLLHCDSCELASNPSVFVQVYDFALPLLVLHAFTFQTAKNLRHWLTICPRQA